jgi:septin family protein
VNEVHHVTATVKECESKGTIRQYKSSIELDGFNLDLSVVDDDQIDDDIGDDVPLYHHGVDYLLSEFDSLLNE